MTAQRAKGIRIEQTADEILALKVATSEVHALNQSAAVIFEFCDGKTSKAQMAAELRRRTGLPEDEQIVDLALNELVDAGLVTLTELTSGRLEELWGMFDKRLRAMLPVVRQQLGIPWFPLVKVERQLTAHARGGFFVPHVDTGDARIRGRRISCVYYFHLLPKRFSGGELKLYDTWVTPTGSTGAGTYTTLEPIDNSIVFFSSDAFHEVCPVETETEAFADSRFTVTIWFWEPMEPTALISQQASDEV